MNRLLVFLAVFVSLILPADAQDLWSRTRAGMTVDDVSDLYPNAVPPSDPSSAVSETKVLLTIPSIQIQDDAYRVAFIFRDEQLEKVSLSFIENRSFDSMLPVYNAVLARWRANYGPEISHRSDRSDLIKNEEHTWFSEGRSVQMSMTSLTGKDAFFAIRYQAKSAADTDKP